jgi:serine/threonine protein kinase
MVNKHVRTHARARTHTHTQTHTHTHSHTLSLSLSLSRTHERTHTHTYRYRAPELLMCESTYEHKIDEWSVGCILLEMVIGRSVSSCTRLLEPAVRANEK